MPDRARVTSLEAIESFRAKLIIYREKAGRVLDEVNDEVVRTRLWLEGDRQTFWQSQIRARTRVAEQKQQELFSAQISGLTEASAVQQAAVHRARRAIRAAEEKLKLVKQWQRQFDHRVEPQARQAEKLHHTLSHDLGHAVVWLNEVIKTIAEYSELSPSTNKPAASAAPPETTDLPTEPEKGASS